MLPALALVATAGCTTASPDDPPGSDVIEIVVVLPVGWPEPFYPGQPEVTIERVDGPEVRFETTGRRTSVVLPEPGDYRVGAIIEDGGCFDTAGVANAGNPPVTVSNGDVFELVDTGELCD